MAGKASIKDGAHKASKLYPTVCARYSAKHGQWLWGYRIAINGKRAHVHLFESERLAHETAASTLADQRAGALGQLSQYRPTLAELITRYLATLSPGDKTAATRAFRVWVSEWLADARLLTAENWLDLLGSRLRVDEVRAARFKHLLDAPALAQAKPGTVRRYLASICAALNRAGEWFEELEQWRPPKPPHVSMDRNPVARTITDEEYRALIAWLSQPDLYPNEVPKSRKVRLQLGWIFRALMLTGMRPGELYTLEWKDVFFDARQPYLLVRAQKTAKKKPSVRPIPITPELREVLDAQREFAHERKYIFYNRTRLNDSMRRILKLACEAIGIPYGRGTENGLLLRFARHTTATHLLDAGFSVAEVAGLLGNTPDVLSRHYLGRGRNTAHRLGEALSQREQSRLQPSVDQNLTTPSTNHGK